MENEMTNCADFESWLDRGQPAREQPRANEHLAGCLPCRRALQAAEEVERLLAITVPVEPGGDFNDAVIRRIHENQTASTPQSITLDILAQPTVAVSIAILASIASCFAIFAASAGQLYQRLLQLTDTLARADATPGLAFATAALTACISWQLFRFYERITVSATSWMPNAARRTRGAPPAP